MDRSPLRVIVTAAGGGIGRRIAERFADQGARVHASDVDGEAIEAAFAASNAVTGARVDVTDEAAVNAWMDTALADMSGIDVLVNCAGTAGPTSSLEDMDFDEWQRCLNVNLNGQFLCSKRAIPPMKVQRSGLIVNFSSTAGLQGFARRAPYCTAKWGVIGFTKTLAIELGPYNVRCNCICPGAVEGDRMDRVIAAEAAKTGRSEDEVRAEITNAVSMKMFVTADDMADMVLFLASPAASMVNGQALPVDGHNSAL
jgi:NAD(P)-dependent dehydrogenase (short-subunit alcohol dehydrogenase family)